MTKNIAHRGYSARYPENTMLAFEQAVLAGCDGIELDVQLSLDEVPVIIHDETLQRTTNGNGPVAAVKAAGLQALNAGQGQGVPTLKEYFEWVRDKEIFTNIELKNSVNPYPGMEEIVIKMVREYGLQTRIVFSSFNHYSMVKCRELAPNIPCGLLYDCWLLNPGGYVKQNKMQFAHPHSSSVTPQMAENCRQNGVGINTWTVNDEAEMRRLLMLGVNGIVTNEPGKLHDVMQTL